MPVKPNIDFRLNKPFLTSIIEIKQENQNVKTFIVDYNPIDEPIEMRPGQFVMVWIPGIDEIPMSISHIGWENRIAITVAAVGDATEALHKLELGDQIGIRGPYGNWYEPKDGTAIVVGGGIGMASVLPLIDQLVKEQKNPIHFELDQVICIEGAKTESDLLFMNEIADIYADESAMEFCTDDGSCGFKGFTTEKLEMLLQQEIEDQKARNETSPITVYSCGPEIMLKKVFEICEKYGVEVQASLERMMRCGFGMCGLCALEPTGLLVCFDGPVFTNDVLRKTTDFGKYHRDFSGKPFKI